MAHVLTFTVNVDENDNEDEIEESICKILSDIFISTVSLLDFCANNSITTSTIKQV